MRERGLRRAAALWAQVAWVPGSFELPVVAKRMADSGHYTAVVCIGAIVSAPDPHPAPPQHDGRPGRTAMHRPRLRVRATGGRARARVLVVACSAQIQGATSHYDAVVSAATSGVLGASVQTGVPVVFGVLTTDNLEQVRAQ